jgi:hypothetical protein
MSRALVDSAERGVRAEAGPKQQLKAAYRNFVQEAEPERKNEAGRELIRATSRRIPLPKIQFSDLPTDR